MLFAKGLLIQIQVVHALILRETRTSFGAHQLGYIWAFAESITMIAIFATMFFIVNRTTPNGTDPISFLTTGIVPFLLFRQTTSKTMSAISANKALLFYPQIRPLDLVIARACLEGATLSIVFVVILTFNSLFNTHLPIDNILNILIGLSLASLLGASLGLTLCSLSVFSNVIERIVSPVLRPLFWISGLFFTANDLPSHVRDIFLWNPLLHILELVRDGAFITYTSHYINIEYILAWIIGLAFLGLTAERIARRKIEVT